MNGTAWRVFSVDELTRDISRGEPRFVEFLRTAALSCAVYHLPAGARDMQAPHLEDELYFVLKGRARLRVGGEERNVAAGSILYVRATSDHTFFDIEEDLMLIAVFGPAR